MRASEPWLECAVCRAKLEIGPQFGGCPECARQGRRAPLEVRYDCERLGLGGPDGSAPGIWRWRSLLPPAAGENVVSLYEGNTPLVPLKGWDGSPRLYLKNESVNPTWSYKDRANTVSISMARQFGFQNVATVSTGNHGNSAAAYAASAGLRCVIFCHPDAPELQLRLMHWYGARAFRGGSQDELLQKLVERGGWFPATIACPQAGCGNPYGIEGFKTIAFEVFEQMGRRVPDRVFTPVGSGDGLHGIWKGFIELRQIGAVDRVPRMYACQAAGADPYVRAFRARAPRLTALESARTIALSIAEKIGGERVLQAVYDSGGEALAVSDQDILRAALCLAREGLALEPASAAAVAAAEAVRAEGNDSSDEVWLAIGTGAVVKWPDALSDGFALPEPLPASFNCIEQLEL